MTYLGYCAIDLERKYKQLGAWVSDFVERYR